jgi:hypothetical protein
MDEDFYGEEKFHIVIKLCCKRMMRKSFSLFSFFISFPTLRSISSAVSFTRNQFKGEKERQGILVKLMTFRRMELKNIIRD